MGLPTSGGNSGPPLSMVLLSTDLVTWVNRNPEPDDPPSDASSEGQQQPNITMPMSFSSLHLIT